MCNARHRATKERAALPTQPMRRAAWDRRADSHAARLRAETGEPVDERREEHHEERVEWDLHTWAHPCHICAGTGRTPATSAPGLGSTLPTSAPGLGSPLPRLCQHWAHRCHVSAGNGLTAAALRQDWAQPSPHLRQDWAQPSPHLRRDCACRLAPARASPPPSTRSG